MAEKVSILKGHNGDVRNPRLENKPIKTRIKQQVTAVYAPLNCLEMEPKSPVAGSLPALLLAHPPFTRVVCDAVNRRSIRYLASIIRPLLVLMPIFTTRQHSHQVEVFMLGDAGLKENMNLAAAKK
jgi:hypothetical protein